jgi:hypothetical protein
LLLEGVGMLSYYLKEWPKTDAELLKALKVAIIAERIANANGSSLGPNLGIVAISTKSKKVSRNM